jgi:hypothetical protein
MKKTIYKLIKELPRLPIGNYPRKKKKAAKKYYAAYSALVKHYISSRDNTGFVYTSFEDIKQQIND